LISVKLSLFPLQVSFNLDEFSAVVCHSAHQFSYRYQLSLQWEGTGNGAEEQKGLDFFQCWGMHQVELLVKRCFENNGWRPA